MLQIYSKHKDYYDGSLINNSSLDKFVRYTVENDDFQNSDIKALKLSSRVNYLFCCGEIYPFIKTETMVKTGWRINYYDYKGKPVYTNIDELKHSFLWSLDEIDLHFRKEHYSSYSWFYSDINQIIANVSQKLLEKIQIDSKVCYFTYEPDYSFKDGRMLNKMVEYPSLQDIQFFKAVDPFTLAQRIDYWLGNKLVSDDCPNNQTNEEKIVAHGHNLKISFRDASRKGKKKNAKRFN